MTKPMKRMQHYELAVKSHGRAKVAAHKLERLLANFDVELVRELYGASLELGMAIAEGKLDPVEFMPSDDDFMSWYGRPNHFSRLREAKVWRRVYEVSKQDGIEFWDACKKVGEEIKLGQRQTWDITQEHEHRVRARMAGWTTMIEGSTTADSRTEPPAVQ